MNRIALAALVLWAATIAVIGWFFVKGVTVATPDGRVGIVLADNERDHVMTEMRGLLQAVAGLTEALSRGDRAAMVQIAGAVGTASFREESPVLLAKLPLAFKSGGMAIHSGFDDIAREAGAGAPDGRLTALLAAQLARCTACHAGYRFAP